MTPHVSSFFFFNDTATTEIYTLSLHDALPIWNGTAISASRFLRKPAQVIGAHRDFRLALGEGLAVLQRDQPSEDRKSTRLNSSHLVISYAVFCLKKKKDQITLIDLS